MTSKYSAYLQPHCLIFIAILLTTLHPIFAKVGLNCTAGDDCDEKAPCPPGSILDKIAGVCICNPDHCTPPPQCLFTSKFIIKHNATGEPGDCCNIYECVLPSELNCTGVVCPLINVTCPSDSLSLPKRHKEGECCSQPGGCECLPSSCQPHECPDGFKAKIVQPGTNIPGSCCPVYECQPYHLISKTNCLYEDRIVENGERWKKEKCIECVCTNGEIHCTNSSTKCPPLPVNCSKHSQQDNCCPCKVYADEEPKPAPPGGCKHGGVIYNNEASWYEDKCTKCTCINGEANCLAGYCMTQTCLNRSCCPTCTGSTNIPPDCPEVIDCKLECEYGFARDESSCPICKCNEEETDDCQLQCTNGFVKDENGIERCECEIVTTKITNDNKPYCPTKINCHKKCKFGYKMNKLGCPICKCNHPCKAIDHSCKKNCPHGLQTDSEGCLVCKCKGSPYKTDDDYIMDSTTYDCSTELDIWHDDGEAWNDGCRQCYCHKGREMCALIACPKLECADPIITKRSCCPTCPGNNTRLATQVVCYGPDGLLKMEGESWSIGCVNCICHGGRVMCNKQVCPPAPCSHPSPPPPGECCPKCTTEMLPIVTSLQGCGVDRLAGSTWREGNCVSCICTNGIASCFTESCHQVDITCKMPLQVKNLCCSICLDGAVHDDTTCRVDNVTFNLGAEWEADKCKRCRCEPGRTVSCVQTVCENSCSPKLENNPCCPFCKDSDSRTEPITYSLWSFLLFAIICLFIAGILAFWTCCLRRHQLKICQPHPAAYPYKYVPTFDGPTSQSSPLTLKSPV